MKGFLKVAIIGLFALVSCNRQEDTEVLVVGGGASGVAAGIQSARMGVRTVILEETPWLGGMLTSAGVSCIDGNYRLRSGIFGEFTDSLAARYGGYDALQSGWVSLVNFDPQIGQEIFTDMAETCGELLDVRRETVVTDVAGKAGDWTVSYRDASGKKHRINADILIDATELGDVAKACGVDYRIGMEASSLTGESIAPDQSNDVIQDLTYVAFLKDYGPDADMTIPEPEGYDLSLFANSALNPMSTVAETGQTIWSPEMMISYGKTPQGRYMINWPIYGNDFYVNAVEMDREQRDEAFAQAKKFTLSFIYFIQTQLGMRNLGIADDVFPTEDGLPFFPYHRESRRIVGEAFFTMDAAADPYGFEKPYYRTGIAVGDYAVDHHHFRHPDWKSLPDLHFYPIPSFNVPMGTIIPKQTDDLIVAEKSISVSNLMNGATRLQPVVMQIGQAAGALAAIAVTEGRSVKEVGVRQLQEALLESGCFIMPYLDLPREDRHFKALQRIGATGILRGEGRNAGWENQTWFRAADPLLGEEIYVSDLYGGFVLEPGEITVGRMLELVRAGGGAIPYGSEESWWNGLGLKDYDPTRTAIRLEAAVVIDAAFDPFGKFEVDYDGYFVK
ncbi:MAG: FAD-dependent oxidoreductase [Bacteroidales bacterium]|nr:FAD-dependent oxidoreductase [Bacteroidales bacterium]